MFETTSPRGSVEEKFLLPTYAQTAFGFRSLGDYVGTSTGTSRVYQIFSHLDTHHEIKAQKS